MQPPGVFILSLQRIPLIATAAVCVLLYATACLLYPGFFSLLVLKDLLADNAVLGVAAIGATFVILSGGIDLSVGAVIGCATITMAVLIERAGMHPLIVIPLIVLAGTAFGASMGALIHLFSLPPFLVTLAGLFFCRGLGLVISKDSVGISHPLYTQLTSWSIPMGQGVALPMTAVIFLVVLAVAVWISLYTSFGRNVYAIGGSESSAMLMGLPVGATKIGVYAISGLCSTLAAVVSTIYTPKGWALTGTGLELDAIAAVVVGGTLLSGGVGYVAGTLLGVMIFGIIQTMINFQNLNSWWTRIAVGLLLLGFVLLQKLIQRRDTSQSY
ncbi:galactofuranose ABC transporter, permease protein YjfF [Fontivita pretiosa]|uniref:galactofuranose ABC transporter, permease protein YjfF n=1 Tax=Fontivita pretiosa TaxID=2989684 RepID=UPI003D16BC54